MSYVTPPDAYWSKLFAFQSEDEVLELLLDMCDNLLLGRADPDNQDSDPHGQRCYGIEYIRNEKRAYFLSQNSGERVLTPLTGGGAGEICNNPEAVMYFARGGRSLHPPPSTPPPTLPLPHKQYVLPGELGPC